MNMQMKVNVKFLMLWLLLASVNVGFAQNVNQLPDWAFGGFVRPANVNPVISPNSKNTFIDPMTGKSVKWEENDTFNPAAVIKNKKIVVIYRAEDKSGIKIGHRTSRLGYASSKDGVNFKRLKKPVMYPGNDSEKENEWPGGSEDPRIAMTEGGLYVMFYTQWNRKVPRLGVATSKNLKKWTKHGSIFKDAYDGKFYNMSHKSASILTKLVNDKQVITKVNGKYWMYWGEKHVYAATSDDLLKWTPLVDDNEKLKELISPRKGYFDSKLTECGPPAILTDKGILLLYNGKNDTGENRDPRFNAGTYSAGQVLFDSNNPEKVLARLDVPFLRPMEPFEKSGQYVDGTVFIEGLVYFKKKWFMYYGCADSQVAVAVYDPANPSLPDPIK